MTPAEEERAAVVAETEAKIVRYMHVSLLNFAKHACRAGASPDEMRAYEIVAAMTEKLTAAILRGDHRAPATGK